MATISNPETLIGQTAYDNDGDKIGKVGQVYIDQDGTNESFVPLERVTQSGDDVRIDIDKATIKDAPNVAADGAISPEEEDSLYTYYGLGTGTSDTTSYTDTTDTTGTGYTESAGHDTSGPNTDDAMTRSEEQLHVGRPSTFPSLTKRSASRASRSRRLTPATRSTAPQSPKRSTRSLSTRNAPSWRRKPFLWSA
jgi:hypothetical protein